LSLVTFMCNVDSLHQSTPDGRPCVYLITASLLFVSISWDFSIPLLSLLNHCHPENLKRTAEDRNQRKTIVVDLFFRIWQMNEWVNILKYVMWFCSFMWHLNVQYIVQVHRIITYITHTRSWSNNLLPVVSDCIPIYYRSMLCMFPVSF